MLKNEGIIGMLYTKIMRIINIDDHMRLMARRTDYAYYERRFDRVDAMTRLQATIDAMIGAFFVTRGRANELTIV